jgi:hypothetical protein
MTSSWRSELRDGRGFSLPRDAQVQQRRSRVANASPLATHVASTAKGNRRRAASGKVCSNASAYPNASMPRGGVGWAVFMKSVNMSVLTPAAASASPLSNTQALAGSRRDPPAHSFMI